MKIEVTAQEAFETVRSGDTDSDTIWLLIEALNNGFPLQSITELVNSSTPGVSSAGVYILEELSCRKPEVRERIHELRDTALALSRSPDGWRRKVSVEFFMNSRLIDEAILEALATSLGDTDCHVRSWAINWVLKSPSAAVLRLASHLFGPVETAHALAEKLAAVDRRNRQSRAFKIAVLIKAGNGIHATLDDAGFEDSFIYEALEHIESVHRRPWRPMELPVVET
ncbi:hypothetical protein [Mesorhizobium sp. KR9-304]|uniref:hypothetical protein n=1 Tax=Mesorhizobium sp. KR9-304 TaxID=3156614 RepID=UPI0032B3C623